MKRCKYIELFSGDDIATEILSRLPIKSLVAFKCTSKRWYSFLSDPLFLDIYYQRSKKEITRLVMQHIVLINEPFETRFDSIDLLTPGTKTGYELNYKSLDFLPEKVIVLSSSNGILCCRSWVDLSLRESIKKTVTYICNPLTRQWVQVTSIVDDYRSNLAPGFAFYPSYSSSSADSIFKLVNITFDYESMSCSFDIYSSDTNKWNRSKAVCKTKALICFVKDTDYPAKVVFANGWFHWWTEDHQIVAFHVEKELCKVIKLPCTLPHDFTVYYCTSICWGESEGYLHCVYAEGPELQVWVLKNYEEEEHAWELKYSLELVRFRRQHPILRGKSWLRVLTFHEDVLYIKPGLRRLRDLGNLVSYDFRTKILTDHGEYIRQLEKDPNSTIAFPLQNPAANPIVVPFSASLVPLQGVRCSKRNRKRKLFSASLVPLQGVRRSKRNRKRKLLEMY